jgi:hypothetical protein
MEIEIREFDVKFDGPDPLLMWRLQIHITKARNREH